MRRLVFAGFFVALLALPAIAQDAQVGKEYDISIETEQTNQYTGPFGQAKVGAVVFDVPNAKKAEKYHVKVTAIAKNQYTGDVQASCEFQQTGGNRTGECIAAP
jgi:hypothetical protein